MDPLLLLAQHTVSKENNRFVGTFYVSGVLNKVIKCYIKSKRTYNYPTVLMVNYRWKCLQNSMPLRRCNFHVCHHVRCQHSTCALKSSRHRGWDILTIRYLILKGITFLVLPLRKHKISYFVCQFVATATGCRIMLLIPWYLLQDFYIYCSYLRPLFLVDDFCCLALVTVHSFMFSE